MKIEKIQPFYTNEAAGGSATSDYFDFAAVTAKKTNIATTAEDAKKILENETVEINSKFGENGTVMRGGSSNVINSKWNELTDSFNNMVTYINSTLEKVSTASRNNETIETTIINDLFAKINTGSTGGSSAGNNTTSFYG